MLNGHRKEKDAESKERWILTRKIMWSNIVCHYKGELDEKKILLFPWESIKKLSKEESEKMRLELEAAEKFWQNWDEKKKAKA